MKQWGLRISVALSALAVAASGSWYVWREFYSGEQFRTAIAEGIESGADVNMQDKRGWTALHRIAYRYVADGEASLEKARLLTEYGADPNLKNRNGRTPIDRWPELAEIVKEVEAEKASSYPC